MPAARFRSPVVLPTCTIARVRPYANRSGDSAIRAYEIGPDFISVEFRSGKSYVYTFETAGSDNVEQMKQLAAEGRGLGTFISQHSAVRSGYVKQTHST